MIIMRKCSLLILLLPILFSCSLIDLLDEDNFNDYGRFINFSIVNSNSTPISGLKVYLTNDSNVNTGTFSLEPSEQMSLSLDMKNAINVDGSYTIKYVIENEIRERSCGYYSNGRPLEEKIEIILNSDGFECFTVGFAASQFFTVSNAVFGVG